VHPLQVVVGVMVVPIVVVVVEVLVVDAAAVPSALLIVLHLNQGSLMSKSRMA
jgi:hypothetical protein